MHAPKLLFTVKTTALIDWDYMSTHSLQQSVFCFLCFNLLFVLCPTTHKHTHPPCVTPFYQAEITLILQILVDGMIAQHYLPPADCSVFIYFSTSFLISYNRMQKIDVFGDEVYSDRQTVCWNKDKLQNGSASTKSSMTSKKEIGILLVSVYFIILQHCVLLFKYVAWCK